MKILNSGKCIAGYREELAKISLLLTLFFISIFTAQAQKINLVVRGSIKDEQNAVIAGAEIRLIEANGETRRQTISDRQGTFHLENLTPGFYNLQISAAGFASRDETLDLSAADKPKEISIILRPTIEANVEVSSENSLDAERAAGSQILSAKEIENLPDDPDQLSRQLQNLAASGGSPGDSTVTIDGFLTGGKLPPKSSVQQVRINPNLFAAEYDTPPFQGGRIEIVTKPGSGSMSGAAFFNYNGTALNARDPLSVTRAATRTNRYGLNFGMPVVKNRSGFFLDFEKRDIDEPAIVNAIIPGDNFQPANYVFNAPAPKRLTIGAARADWQINPNNALIVRYDFNRNELAGLGIGETNLPERGFDNIQTENSFRLTETAVVTPRAVNELRIGLTFNRIDQNAVSALPSVIVAGSFASGGANAQKLARREKLLEIVDNLTTDAGRHSLKFGTQIYNRRIDELRADNTNGSFFFGGATLADGTRLSSFEQYRRALLSLPGGAPTRFSVTFGAPRVAVSQWLFAGYVQDEWKLSPRVLISYGLRHEGQTAPANVVSLAPRIGAAFVPDEKQNWVFRARAGVFYTRFPDSIVLETERLDGRRQRQIIIDAPSFPNPLSGAINRAIPTIRIFDAGLNASAALQTRVEAERQLPQGWKISVNYNRVYNWNRLRSRNINAPLIDQINADPQTAPRPLGIDQNVLQFESSGRLEGGVFYVGVNQNTNRFFSLNAGYLNFDFQTDADTPFSLPQSSYTSAGEWANPFWQTSHRLFLITTANLPYKLIGSASLNAASGTAFNITTGRDNNGDGNFNDRPGSGSPSASQAVATVYGVLDPNAINGDFRRNAGTNPATATLDLNLSRVFAFGENSAQGSGRFRLTVNARAANALNRANLFGTVGVLSAPLFGRPTAAYPARRIEFGLRFNF